ncbi:hypothetical protein FKM82_018981 [Ascaphus truei]
MLVMCDASLNVHVHLSSHVYIYLLGPPFFHDVTYWTLNHIACLHCKPCITSTSTELLHTCTVFNHCDTLQTHSIATILITEMHAYAHDNSLLSTCDYNMPNYTCYSKLFPRLSQPFCLIT